MRSDGLSLNQTGQSGHPQQFRWEDGTSPNTQPTLRRIRGWAYGTLAFARVVSWRNVKQHWKSLFQQLPLFWQLQLDYCSTHELKGKLMAVKHQRYTARKATEADIPALKDITGHDESRRLSTGGPSHHPENCIMVVEEAGKSIGSVFVVFVRPPQWPDADDNTQATFEASHLPYLISMVVKGACRNRGAGTYLIGAVEKEAKSRGYKCVYLTVEPEDAGARRFYQRLGFEPLSTEPRRSTRKETDANGVVHEVVEWGIDLVKKLS